jgi:hypothetical protein
VAENIVVVMVLMAGSQSGNLFNGAIYKRDSPASCDGQHSLAFCTAREAGFAQALQRAFGRYGGAATKIPAENDDARADEFCEPG